MEIIDYSDISTDVAQQAFAKADPCPNCQSKDDLALGMISEGEHTGRLIIFCFRCSWSPTDGVRYA